MIVSNRGNNGAVQLVTAIQKIAGQQSPQDRIADLGTIRADYSLVTDSFPVPIPRGEWFMIRRPVTAEDSGLRPGDRVAVIWVGNEAVVIGSITRM